MDQPHLARSQVFVHVDNQPQDIFDEYNDYFKTVGYIFLNIFKQPGVLSLSIRTGGPYDHLDLYVTAEPQGGSMVHMDLIYEK